MGPEIELALKLQNLDKRIDELEKEIATLPKHIAGIEKQLTSHQRRLEADQAALAGNEKSRRKLESTIQTFEEKISKLKNQMLDATTNEQYRAFQHEIGFCETEISKAEDRVLELMEESEALSENVEKAEVALKREKQQVDAEKQEARQRTAADQTELAAAVAEREAAASGLPVKILRSYERSRKKFGYPVLAEGVNGRCSACNIALRPQFFQDLRHSTEPLLCESCGRLLYYHPVIDAETEAAL
jgi:hypothetical protein